MKCSEKDCPGQVSLKSPVLVRVGCRSFGDAFPCDICGRLHWKYGEGMYNRSGQRAFVDAKGQQFLKDPEQDVVVERQGD